MARDYTMRVRKDGGIVITPIKRRKKKVKLGIKLRKKFNGDLFKNGE